MSETLSELTKDETETVREILQDFIASMRVKRGGAGSKSRLLPDEESVFGSLTHPERGDVIVTILRLDNKLQIFLSNRRDVSTPFSIMAFKDIRYFPGRRTLDGSRVDTAAEGTGLFLSSIQDQEILKEEGISRVDVYSVHFGVYEPGAVQEKVRDADDELKLKPLNECDTEEKWLIYEKNWDMDSRRKVIEKELFSFPLYYAKYNREPREEIIVLTPERYRNHVGQLIRDIYPTGVKASLRRDFPGDHKKKTEESQGYLNALVIVLKNRISEENGQGYNGYLDELVKFINHILTSDPEMLTF